MHSILRFIDLHLSGAGDEVFFCVWLFSLFAPFMPFVKCGCQNPVMVHFFLSLAMGVNQTLIIKVKKISEKSL